MPAKIGSKSQSELQPAACALLRKTGMESGNLLITTLLTHCLNNLLLLRHIQISITIPNYKITNCFGYRPHACSEILQYPRKSLRKKY